MFTTFSSYYDDHIKLFGEKRKSMLNVINESIPKSSDHHRREWKVQQLDNASVDLKNVISACNSQLNLERAKIDELKHTRSQLRAEKAQLVEDATLLQAVTGIHVDFPYNIENEDLKKINLLSKQFRDNFTDFAFSLPPLPTNIHFDPAIQRDADGLVQTLKDYVSSEFHSRSQEANNTKVEFERKQLVSSLKSSVLEKEAKLNDLIETQKRRVEQSAQRMENSINIQVKNLQKDNIVLMRKLKLEQAKIESKVADLKFQEKRLKGHCNSMRSQNHSIQENFKRKAAELELELDKFERRIEYIQDYPSQVDQQLINTSLILTNKSNKLFKAIHEMRNELSLFNEWILKGH